MSDCAPTRTVGPFVVGEKPAPLEYQFLDNSGVPINLSGYTAKFVYQENDGTATTVNATVSDPTNGKVTYTWTGAEFPTPGHYFAYFWVGNLANRFASLRIVFAVSTTDAAVPAI